MNTRRFAAIHMVSFIRGLFSARQPGENEDPEYLASPDRMKMLSEQKMRQICRERLQASVTLPFNEANEEHMLLLSTIWSQAFPWRSFELPSESWKEAGFQGRDPRTDLRGTGVISLRHLQSFLSTRKDELAGVLPAESSSDPLRAFPLSIASINVSAMLLSHLQLAPHLTIAFLPNGGRKTQSSAATLAGFLSMGQPPTEGSTEAVQEGGAAAIDVELGDEAQLAARIARLEYILAAMHERLLMHLAATWGTMLREDPQLTIMSFPVALKSTFGELIRSLERTAADALGAVRPWQLRVLVWGFAWCSACMCSLRRPLSPQVRCDPGSFVCCSMRSRTPLREPKDPTATAGRRSCSHRRCTRSGHSCSTSARAGAARRGPPLLCQPLISFK